MDSTWMYYQSVLPQDMIWLWLLVSAQYNWLIFTLTSVCIVFVPCSWMFTVRRVLMFFLLHAQAQYLLWLLVTSDHNGPEIRSASYWLLVLGILGCLLREHQAPGSCSSLEFWCIQLKIIKIVSLNPGWTLKGVVILLIGGMSWEQPLAPLCFPSCPLDTLS